MFTWRCAPSAHKILFHICCSAHKNQIKSILVRLELFAGKIKTHHSRCPVVLSSVSVPIASKWISQTSLRLIWIEMHKVEGQKPAFEPWTWAFSEGVENKIQSNTIVATDFDKSNLSDSCRFVSLIPPIRIAIADASRYVFVQVVEEGEFLRQKNTDLVCSEQEAIQHIFDQVHRRRFSVRLNWNVVLGCWISDSEIFNPLRRSGLQFQFNSI